MKKYKSKWTNESLQIESNKYKTRGEFQKNSRRAYQISRRRKILDQICYHMPKRASVSEENNPAFKWTFEKIKAEALKCKSRKMFFTKNGSAYNSAIRTGVLDEVCSHMSKNLSIGRNPDKWTKEAIQAEALKYKTRGEFRKSSGGAYGVASHKGILKSICNHMIYVRSYRTDAQLYEISKNYNDVGTFQKKENGAYQAAFKRGMLEDICKHMQKNGGVSILEKDVFAEIKKIYPEAQKLMDRKIFIPNKPHIQGFDIDIYVPELQKGIEFDGKYWHSDIGLRRSRKHWPQEDVDNYHQIKDAYFISKGIQILHVQEEDWIKNKEKCLNKCFKFLKR